MAKQPPKLSAEPAAPVAADPVLMACEIVKARRKLVSEMGNLDDSRKQYALSVLDGVLADLGLPTPALE